MRAHFSVLATAVLALVASTGVSLAGPAVIQIPEPSSLALIAAGAGVLAWVKFRKR
jgi:PEP-CTERM motif-containing protein